MAKNRLLKDIPFVWTPMDLVTRPDISAGAKVLWAYMNGKPDGWEFSSARMSKDFKESDETIKKWMRELVDAGYMSRSKLGNGHFEYVLYPKPQKPTKAKTHEGKMGFINNIENNKDRNISNKDLIVPKGTIGENADGTYGKVEINNLFSSWESITGLPITSNKTKNRYACNNLINKYGVDGVEKLIRVVEKAQTDRYAPRVADFCDLQAKLNQLLLWAKNQVTNSQVISVEDF